MVNTLFINIFAAVATGGAVVSSQYLGQRRRDRACQSANQLILITGVISLVIMGLCILFRQGVLILLYGGVAGDVMANALVYLTISALSYPFLAVYNSCAALFRSMGNSKISSAGVRHHEHHQCHRGRPVYLCIPLECGGCRCGFPGFAHDRLFYSSLSAENKNLDIFIGGRWKFNLRMVKQILGIGIPNGIENSIFQLGRVLVVGS
ncbi:MAG: MATE family efflux transporter [Enterocloster clostridioformis]